MTLDWPDVAAVAERIDRGDFRGCKELVDRLGASTRRKSPPGMIFLARRTTVAGMPLGYSGYIDPRGASVDEAGVWLDPECVVWPSGGGRVTVLIERRVHGHFVHTPELVGQRERAGDVPAFRA